MKRDKEEGWSEGMAPWGEDTRMESLVRFDQLVN